MPVLTSTNPLIASSSGRGHLPQPYGIAGIQRINLNADRMDVLRHSIHAWTCSGRVRRPLYEHRLNHNFGQIRETTVHDNVSLARNPKSATR
jgi:hypothetical protein